MKPPDTLRQVLVKHEPSELRVDVDGRPGARLAAYRCEFTRCGRLRYFARIAHRRGSVIKFCKLFSAMCTCQKRAAEFPCNVVCLVRRRKFRRFLEIEHDSCWPMQMVGQMVSRNHSIWLN